MRMGLESSGEIPRVYRKINVLHEGAIWSDDALALDFFFVSVVSCNINSY